jgi:hypothetical protein
LLAQIVVNVNRPIFPPVVLVQRRKAHSQCLAIQPARVPRGCRFAIFQLRVCLVSHFTKQIFGFGSSFCKMKLNTMQNFWQKCIHSPF